MKLTLSQSINLTTGIELTLVCEEGYSASPNNGTLICDENGAFVEKPSCLGITLIWISGFARILSYVHMSLAYYILNANKDGIIYFKINALAQNGFKKK